MEKNIYKISFKKNSHHNYRWRASISSISKKELLNFIKYLYSLNRDILVFPYLPGGLSGVALRPYMNKTDLVKNIAKDIEDKVPIDKMLNKNFNRDKNDRSTYGIHFSEDVYEFYLSLGIDEKLAYEAVSAQWCARQIKENLLINKLRSNRKLKRFIEWIGDDYLRDPFWSRWTFIYMFRTEFKKYMYDKGYIVEVEGGWVLNDKKREMALGLIDEEGNLF